MIHVCVHIRDAAGPVRVRFRVQEPQVFIDFAVRVRFGSLFKNIAVPKFGTGPANWNRKKHFLNFILLFFNYFHICTS